LGFKATDKILIINVDDVGNSHAANAAAIDAMENGLATSATIIVPGPWFPEIAAYAKTRPNSDFGVHLAHTSEWKTLKWGPVASKTEVPGLVDPQGYLWPDIMSVYKNSTPQQAYIEARAQIKKALDAGIDLTHLDSHMGTLQYNEEYFQIYRRLAKEFSLPLRMGSQDLLAAQGGGHQRGQLDSDGTIYPDFLIHGDRKSGEPIRDYWKRSISALKPGVTEREAVEVYELEIVRRGAQPFFTVITIGERASLADVYPSDRAVQPGDLIRFDLGCLYKTYRSDISRTAVCGAPTDKQARYYGAVLAGEKAAIAAMKPGVPASRIFEIGVRVTRESGLPHYERTHVGHGIGLEPYDPPTLNASMETPLEPGMVFCVETPYYEHGWGGVQVEDAVEITASGVRRMTRSSQDLQIIG